ncbi:ATP-grasp domain-containing protein [Lacticaseibacillus brantae]|uniref:Phosphoribosylaminoimidazole carboxylase (NCAIR synthetase) n=1 Tax=Lacticaseibacillus brantae DSM 23927 TaxID=1423727 RepID=A0A0R2B1H9_9LACO|nr:ATP-grasp domain-containing protein [Lacticaseibacillus brantae]KRM73087.1 phosphoribosylaminoimidazole carboxylase (NCAIR synthetase) [Lacticaseibacillus brantae DSM 23927]
MAQFIKPDATLGIIGGGLSAFMLAQTAHTLGFKTVILATSQTDIALTVADIPLVGEMTNGAVLAQVAELSTIVTFIDEFVDGDLLQSLTTPAQLPSTTDLLSVTQDRYLERVFFEDENLNILPYAQVLTQNDIESAVDSVGFPCILKPMQKGFGTDQQIKLTQWSDIDAVRQLLQERPYIVEAWLDHPVQLTVFAAKAGDDIQVFPVIEQDMHRQKLRADISPARVSVATQAEVSRIATSLAKAINYTGVFGLELLVNQSGTLYVNRIIPMPTFNGMLMTTTTGYSIYELHLRAILGWPLPTVRPQNPGVMLPVLPGDADAVMTQVQIKPDWRFTFYPEGNHFIGDIQIIGDLPTIVREVNATGHFHIEERK